MSRDFKFGNESSTDIRDDEELKMPHQYRVILLNDDYTPMDFVISIIMTIFHKPFEDATMIMLDVHKKGRGLVGVYTYDIAVTKTMQVHELAKQNEYPLKCIYELV